MDKIEFKDYYNILGIKKDESQEEIKKAYFSLARLYHPDLHPNNKEYLEKMKEINEAYKVLKNPITRKDYDEYLQEVYSKSEIDQAAQKFNEAFEKFEELERKIEEYEEEYRKRRSKIMEEAARHEREVLKKYPESSIKEQRRSQEVIDIINEANRELEEEFGKTNKRG